MGNLYDPNRGKFNVEVAEQMLGMTDEDKILLRQMVAVDLILAHIGITDEQVGLAYAARIKSQVTDAANTLHSLVGDEEDGE